MDADDLDCANGSLESGGIILVTPYRAFGFDDQETLGVYISSNENATCDMITEYLKSDGSFDPSDVISPGRCNLFIKVSGFENGTFQASNDVFVSAASSIECAMGEGDILYTTLDVGDQGYYWTGKWWQGTPKVFDWSFTGDRSQSYTLDIEMSEYAGSFIREEFTNYPALGDVKGTVTVGLVSLFLHGLVLDHDLYS